MVLRPGIFARLIDLATNIFGSKFFRTAITLALLGAAFGVFIPAFAQYGAIFDELSTIRLAWIVALISLTAANITAPTQVHRSLIPSLRLRQGLTTDWASTAATNTLPGGSAVAVGVSWSMYRSFGFSKAEISPLFVVGGIADNVLKLGTPTVALMWLASERPIDDYLQRAALIGILGLSAALVVVAALFSRAVSHSLGGGLNKISWFGGAWGTKFIRLIDASRTILSRRWRRIIGAVIVDQASTFALFLGCVWALEGGRSGTTAAAAFAAFSFGRLASALPITPGGAGVVELSLVAALLGVTSAERSSLVASVLLFRFCSYVVPTVLGLLSWLHWRFCRSRAALDPAR